MQPQNITKTINPRNNNEIPQDKLSDVINQLTKRIVELEEMMKSHNHMGTDGTSVLKNSLELAPSEKVQLGNFRIEEVSFVDQNRQDGYLVVGKDKEDTEDSDNLQLVLQNNGATNGTTNQSFIYANRPPLKKGYHGIAVAGSSEFKTKGMVFTDRELQDATLIVYSAGLATYNVFRITENSGNRITVDGSFSFSNDDAEWQVYMPVYLGAAQFPWRQLYISGETMDGDTTNRRAIRLGDGLTSQCQGIYFGDTNPNGVVTAVPGSFYLSSEGDAYIKSSGTDSGGWDLLQK